MTTTAKSGPCRGCNGIKRLGQYLCTGCWSQLPDPTRAALNIKDGMPAARRLASMLEQIRNGVPLSEVDVR
jgi:hypothetical protein